MRELNREVNTPRFVPDYMAKSIEDIDFKKLARNGVKYIAFDADSTLVPYRGITLSDRTKLYLLKQKTLFTKWCIASNRLTKDLQDLADDLDIELVQATLINRKPWLRFFARVLRHLGGKPEETVMIGDKLTADIWGAKRAGLKTVWVEHLGRDSLPDRLLHLRRWEKRLLKNYL